MIGLRLNTASGVPPFLQIADQIRHAIATGLLHPGDQLPTVKEVVGSLAINPNTVLRAYRELDLEGVAEGRRGVGTFVREQPAPLPADEVEALRASSGWRRRARPASTGTAWMPSFRTWCARRP